MTKEAAKAPASAIAEKKTARGSTKDFAIAACSG